MKKLLLSIALIVSVSTINAQNVYNYGFNNPTATMLSTDGWMATNQSVPVGAGAWTIPATAPTTTFAGGAQSGAATSFVLVNFNSTTGANTISNWLISPTINIQNGDIISFYTRIGRNAAAAFADNLELRLSTNGDFTTNPSLGAEDVGDFTTFCLAVNPDLDLVSYPQTWGQFTYTVTGLSSATDCKIALRYYVPEGGPDGANSDIIGVDTFAVDRPLATDSFFASNYAVGPNPAADVVNISAKNNNTINTVEITDVNGRVVKNVTVNATTSQINVADLNSGVYFLKASSENGVGTSKILKK